MPKADAERLRTVRTFPQLVAYLRDELGWPVDTNDFEDLTYEYDPDELGIDPKNAAKIDPPIRQLRPLTSKQPWGVFFVKFEPKRLPVVALRRILGQLALRKRESADSAERKRWRQHDLLFISAIGEGDERRINFAHFSHDPDRGTADQPILRVLGWDAAQTALRLQHVDNELHQKLTWPDDEDDVDGWRQQWASAFTLRHREVITTAKQLSIRLAKLAHNIREAVNEALSVETRRGPLRRLQTAFREGLIHDLSDDDFADMFAQTISYGLLSTAITRFAGDEEPFALTVENMVQLVPETNPFLRELFSTLIRLGGHVDGINYDELGIQDVVDLLNAARMGDVLRDFGAKNPEEDPVIHFYELFLKEYDPKKRMQRGVFYTPKPVVSYIVRSVHELLQTEFGLEDGLADTTTWGEMLKKHPDLNLPEIEVVDPDTRKGSKQPIDPATPFVQILDPATGTATFLVEVIDLIHKTMVRKWQNQDHSAKEINSVLWQTYVANDLLPRVHGYELMMAPYAIAHMKIGLKLCETGYTFGNDERARIYLTNALESAQDFSDTFEQMAPALAHEAKAVNDVKRYARFTVVIGNPPYSKLSTNWNEWIDGLLHGRGSDSASIPDYYKVDGAGLGERTVWIQDDYIKFTRLSQWQIDRTGAGVHGFISNNGYLDNPTLRGMRQQLRSSFPCMYLLDLHGSMKRGEVDAHGSADGNVFDIQQGVAIGVFAKPLSLNRFVRHADLWGDRTSKYDVLRAMNVSDTSWVALGPTSPFHLLVPVNAANQVEYDAGWKVTDIFPTYHTGIITKRDSLTIHWTKADVLKTVADFMSLAPNRAREKYGLPEDVRDWKVEWAQKDLRHVGLSEQRAIPVLYRPFDVRFTYFTGHTRGFVGWPVADMTELLRPGDNVALVTTRMTKGEDFGHVLATRWMAEVICLSSKTSNNGFVFPLFVNAEPDLLTRKGRDLNLQADFLAALPKPCEPEQAFGYIFALLHSPTYRIRYREFLSRDFPRVLLPRSTDLLDALSQAGKQLVRLHLLEFSDNFEMTTSYRGSSSPEVEKVRYAESTVWLDTAQTCGFADVPEEVWNFQVGGYQVCEKWLKDRQAKGGKNPRPGRKLTAEDITHYGKIVTAIHHTIRLMKEIDEAIDAHGGWPDAFITDPETLETKHPKA